ncbi:enoyl-CoA hydratase/isomerase family protein, partial [Vibrio parahaemolyticus 10296]
ACRFVVRS